MGQLTTIHPELLVLGPEQIHAILPYLWVFGGATLTILASVLRVVNPKWPVFLLSLLTVFFGLKASLELFHGPDPMSLIPVFAANAVGGGLFNGMLSADFYSIFFNIIFLFSAGLTILSSFRYLDREKLQHPEYYVLVLFSALGMMLMTSALDLIVVFIALEIMSLSVYVLVGFRRADRRSNEAAMKYFILGSAASAIFLYGSALLYGATGTTALRGILNYIQTNPQSGSAVLALGVIFILVGFLFKVASVPFHMWMPDVYEGAPTPITGFMTTGLKAAAFGAFLRVLISLGYGKGLTAVLQNHLHDVLWISAALTMVVGNVIALTQTNLKRMLAYSSISHTGYLLLGFIAGPQSDQGYAPVVLYLVAYAAMNLGAFVILTILSQREDRGLGLHDFSGLSRRRPWLAFSLAVFLFSMAGIPPTAGFTAKYLIFLSAVQAGEIPLVVIGVLCSAISVYYYLRVIVYMYMRDPNSSPEGTRVSPFSALAVAAMVLLTLQIGVFPSRLVMAAKKAVSSL